jgi:hypothetical protein
MGIASFLILVLRGGLYSKKCQDRDPLLGWGLYMLDYTVDVCRSRLVPTKSNATPKTKVQSFVIFRGKREEMQQQVYEILMSCSVVVNL